MAVSSRKKNHPNWLRCMWLMADGLLALPSPVLFGPGWWILILEINTRIILQADDFYGHLFFVIIIS